MAPISKISGGIFAAALLCAACNTADKKSTSDSSALAAKTPQPTLAASAPQSTPAVGTESNAIADAPVRTYSGPTIVTDSLVNEPLLELHGNEEWVLRLPRAMARVLYDSLPGFAPNPLSQYGPKTVAWMLERDPGAALPSLVVGDFNGDSTLDVAMEGTTAKESSFFLLLSKSDTVKEPKILIVHRIEGTKPETYHYMGLTHAKHYEETEDVTALDLKHDAVVYGFEMAASIYYVEKGKLTQYSIAD